MAVVVFGYLILISIDSYNFIFFVFSLVLVSIEKINHTKQSFTTFSNTLKFVKNTPLCVIFSTLLLVFENVVINSLLCLTYYIKPSTPNSATFFYHCAYSLSSTHMSSLRAFVYNQISCCKGQWYVRRFDHDTVQNGHICSSIKEEEIFI